MAPVSHAASHIGRGHHPKGDCIGLIASGLIFIGNNRYAECETYSFRTMLKIIVPRRARSTTVSASGS